MYVLVLESGVELHYARGVSKKKEQMWMFLRECDVKLISGHLVAKRSSFEEQGWRARLRGVLQMSCSDTEHLVLGRRHSNFTAKLFEEMIKAGVVKQRAPDATLLTPSGLGKVLLAFGGKREAALVSAAVEKITSTESSKDSFDLAVAEYPSLDGVDEAKAPYRKRRRKPSPFYCDDVDYQRMTLRNKRVRTHADSSEADPEPTRRLRSSRLAANSIPSDWRLKAMSKEKWRQLANSPMALR